MTAFLDFTIESDAFPVGEALDVDAATRIELTQFVPLGEEFAPYFWADTTDEDAVAAGVRASPHVATVDALDGPSRRCLFRVTWNASGDGLVENLRSHDLHVLRVVGADGVWEFKLVADERATFAAFQSACRADGIELTVTRLSDSVARDSALYGLTAKQREALIHAYESGYYDPKTSIGLAELSEELSISQQAFGSRLKRGTGALIRNTLVADSDA